MKTFAIVNRETLRVDTTYQADSKLKYGGPWGNKDLYAHLEIDNSWHMMPLVAHNQQEKWTKEGEEDATEAPLDWEIEGWAYHPPIRVELDAQSMRNIKLSLLRSERDQKIVEADSERKKHEDSDPNAVSTAQAWSDYRIALRNVTDGYKDESDKTLGTDQLDQYATDMSDFTWPAKPE